MERWLETKIQITFETNKRTITREFTKVESALGFLQQVDREGVLDLDTNQPEEE